MKTFVARIANPLDIGQDSVRVALMRYNKFQIPEFSFSDVTNNTDLAAKIAVSMPDVELALYRWFSNVDSRFDH